MVVRIDNPSIPDDDVIETERNQQFETYQVFRRLVERRPSERPRSRPPLECLSWARGIWPDGRRRWRAAAFARD